MIDNYIVCHATLNFSFILMGPALCGKLLKLKGVKQGTEVKQAGRVEDVPGPKAKTILEAVPKRNSELTMQLQQYKDVNTQYLRHST
jgi:hypothetical protein